MPTGTCRSRPGCLDLIAFADRGVVTENDCADLGLFEVERQSVNAAGKFEHLVEHRGAETFYLCHAIANFADNADVGLGGGSALDAIDLAFEFLQNVAHGWIGLNLLRECGETAADTAVPNVAAELDTKPAEEAWRSAKLGGNIASEFLLESVDDIRGARFIQAAMHFR